MLKHALAITLGAAIVSAVPSASAEDLMQIYRDAVANDPTLASARATWQATQEVRPQALANLLPAVNLTGAAITENFSERLHTDPSLSFSSRFPQYQYTVSATQPLFRKQNLVAYDQARQQIGQSDYVLAAAQ